ncbi:MAG: aminotransferase class I/II-fold pyridoxal phosphate-dependent enzyme [Alphaproteobacteria bacterium]
MLNGSLELLNDYPFDRLRSLLEDIPPPDGPTLVLSIGEPQHAAPSFLAEILAANAGSWGRYPPTIGTPEFRAAAADWLVRRFQLPAAMLSPERNILPVAGTREALYMIAQVAIDRDRAGTRPVVLIPDPFYQVYLGAARLHGGEPVFLPALPENGFVSDLSRVPPSVLERTALAYLCTPANPQGSVLDLERLEESVRLARKYDFVLAVDECYSEIYDQDPPPGALQACTRLGQDMTNVVVFHSLSKRSSVPGLRSGFVAGDSRILSAFTRLRAYGGAVTPLPILAAATALWRDEIHVEENRALYRAKMDAAERILGNRFGFRRPEGSFFLWLDVSDGEEAAVRLWREGGLRVLPGAYLSHGGTLAENPFRRYIRVALVHDLDTTTMALRRLAEIL